MNYPIPFNEGARIAALDALCVMDTPPEPAYDDLAHAAQALFGAEIAVLSLVHQARQFFKARLGLDASETGRDVSFCAHALMSEGPLTVLDATRDPRFGDNALVTGPPFIRFYCGAPIVAPGGMRLGSLCVIDPAPRREVSPAAVSALEALARTAARLLSARPIAADAAASAEAAAARARRELTAFANHELRTPLNGVMGHLELAGRGDGATRRDHLRAARLSAELLAQLIDRLTLHCDLESGDLALDAAPIAARDVLDGAIRAAEPARVERGGALVIGAADDALALADGPHLIAALAALAVNAIRHGGGSARMSCGPGPDGGVAFSVEDDGPGFGGKRPPALEGGPRGARAAEGVGVGLAMASRLAEMHGGGVTLRERAEGGVVATLSLPPWRRLEG